MEVVQLQRLSESKDMLGPVISRQRFANRRFGRVAPNVAIRRELLGAWLPATIARMIRMPVAPVMSATA